MNSSMNRLEVHGFSISIDGFGAGVDQRPEQPLGSDMFRPEHEVKFLSAAWRWPPCRVN